MAGFPGQVRGIYGILLSHFLRGFGELRVRTTMYHYTFLPFFKTKRIKQCLEESSREWENGSVGVG